MCVCVCVHLCGCVYLCVCICVATCGFSMFVCMQLCGCMLYGYTCINMAACMRVYAFVWQHACRCGRICVVAGMYILCICECTSVAAYMRCLTMTESFLSKMSCAENTDVRRIKIHKAQTCMKKKCFIINIWQF